MDGKRNYDIFITHAWRYHDDWLRLVDLLNATCPPLGTRLNGEARSNRSGPSRTWRNFSLPWYDPALDPRTERGGKAVRWNLESQIIPVQAVVLLASVLSEPGTRKWLDFELDMARKHRKLIIALPPWGETEVPGEVRQAADTIVPWDAEAILAAVDGAVRLQTVSV